MSNYHHYNNCTSKTGAIIIKKKKTKKRCRKHNITGIKGEKKDFLGCLLLKVSVSCVCTTSLQIKGRILDKRVAKKKKKTVFYFG